MMVPPVRKSIAHLMIDSQMKKPTPPPIPDEGGLCINVNITFAYVSMKTIRGEGMKEIIRITGMNMCFCETKEMKGMRSYCVSEERALIPDWP